MDAPLIRREGQRIQHRAERSPSAYASHNQQIDPPNALQASIATSLRTEESKWRASVLALVDRASLVTAVDRASLVTVVDRASLVTVVDRASLLTLPLLTPHLSSERAEASEQNPQPDRPPYGRRGTGPATDGLGQEHPVARVGFG